MPIAVVLAADRKGPGHIQRQIYVAECITEGHYPSGNPAKGEKLPAPILARLDPEEHEWYLRYSRGN